MIIKSDQDPILDLSLEDLILDLPLKDLILDLPLEDLILDLTVDQGVPPNPFHSLHALLPLIDRLNIVDSLQGVSLAQVPRKGKRVLVPRERKRGQIPREIPREGKRRHVPKQRREKDTQKIKENPHPANEEDMVINMRLQIFFFFFF